MSWLPHVFEELDSVGRKSLMLVGGFECGLLLVPTHPDRILLLRLPTSQPSFAEYLFFMYWQRLMHAGTYLLIPVALFPTPQPSSSICVVTRMYQQFLIGAFGVVDFCNESSHLAVDFVIMYAVRIYTLLLCLQIPTHKY